MGDVNAGRVQSDVRAEQQVAAAAEGDGLDDLTKDELLQEAEDRGVEVKTSASKAEILAALRG
jgi:diphthamide biosynthesis methyltransferase